MQTTREQLVASCWGNPKVRLDGTYDIAFNDGEQEMRVSKAETKTHEDSTLLLETLSIGSPSKWFYFIWFSRRRRRRQSIKFVSSIDKFLNYTHDDEF